MNSDLCIFKHHNAQAGPPGSVDTESQWSPEEPQEDEEGDPGSRRDASKTLGNQDKH